MLSLTSIDDPRNGLLLWKPLEIAFDSGTYHLFFSILRRAPALNLSPAGHLCFLYDPGTDKFRCHVVNPELLERTISDPATWPDARPGIYAAWGHHTSSHTRNRRGCGDDVSGSGEPRACVHDRSAAVQTCPLLPGLHGLGRGEHARLADVRAAGERTFAFCCLLKKSMRALLGLLE